MNSILLPALLTLLPVSQEGSISTAPDVADETRGTEDTSVFGEPLIVNGQRISDLEIKRFLIYGLGQAALGTKRIELLIEQELQLRKANGEDISSLVISDEELQKEFDKTISSFTSRYPTLDVDTEVSRAHKSVNWYKRQLRTTLLFDKIFFPFDPADWPEVTKAAVYAGSPEVDLVADAKKNHDLRVKYAEENETEYVKEDDMFQGLLRDYVIGSLESIVSIKTMTDGLPPELVLTVEGGGYTSEVKTEDFYKEIEEFVNDYEVEQAKKYLTIAAATEARLKADEVWMPQEEYDALMAQMTADLQNTFFSMDFLALQGHQFPSVQTYKANLRLMESFRKKLAPEIADPEEGGIAPVLRDHLSVANSVMGLAKADAEVMLISSYDFLNNTWKKDGWEWAETEAWRLRDEIIGHQDMVREFGNRKRDAAERGEEAEGEEPMAFEQYWSEKMDAHSEFWDPPMPSSGKMPPMQGMKLKGRFGLNTRNDFERAIGESAYRHLLNGYSITDTVFFDVDTGSVSGPFKGPYGYYLIYLRTRTAPTSPLRLTEPKHIELLKEDYLRRRFVKYAQEAYTKAEKSGL